MPTLELTDDEWKQLTLLLTDAPWKIANPIIYKMAKASHPLQAVEPPSPPPAPIELPKARGGGGH